jgi:hypothetical protein
MFNKTMEDGEIINMPAMSHSDVLEWYKNFFLHFLHSLRPLRAPDTMLELGHHDRKGMQRTSQHTSRVWRPLVKFTRARI